MIRLESLSRGCNSPLNDLAGTEREREGDATVDALISGQRSADNCRGPIQGEAGHTGIKLLAVGLQRTAVVHGDFVSLLGLALAVDGDGHVNLELCGVRSDSTDGDRGQGGKE